jgi:antitoxin CptB
VDSRRRARLGWRSRRGMKELDILLQRWLSLRFDLASEGERARFESLLELPDPELMGYLLSGARPVDSGIAALIDDILRC